MRAAAVVHLRTVVGGEDDHSPLTLPRAVQGGNNLPYRPVHVHHRGRVESTIVVLDVGLCLRPALVAFDQGRVDRVEGDVEEPRFHIPVLFDPAHSLASSQVCDMPDLRDELVVAVPGRRERRVQSMVQPIEPRRNRATRTDLECTGFSFAAG